MFTQAVARLQQAVFDRLGEDATWDGIAGTVRVRFRVADEELQLTRGAVIQTGVTIMVRQSDVACPAKGQQLQVLDDDGAPIADQAFEITGKPQRDRKGVWHCPAKPTA